MISVYDYVLLSSLLPSSREPSSAGTTNPTSSSARQIVKPSAGLLGRQKHKQAVRR
jgi:hypothetical protein